jgi:hypothetical protein
MSLGAHARRRVREEPLPFRRIERDVKSEVGISQIHTVAIAVADHERSIDFYVNKLGFEKRMDALWPQTALPRR